MLCIVQEPEDDFSSWIEVKSANQHCDYSAAVTFEALHSGGKVLDYLMMRQCTHRRPACQLSCKGTLRQKRQTAAPTSGPDQACR